MRTGFGLVVGVLTAALAAGGCKECSWCHGDAPPPPARTTGMMPAQATGQAATVGPVTSGTAGAGTLPASAMLPPGAGTGATGTYAGPRN